MLNACTASFIVVVWLESVIVSHEISDWRDERMSTVQTRVGIVMLGVVLAVMAVAYAATSTVTLHNAGTVKGIGVGIYWDNACTDRATSIDWGLAEPGTIQNRTVYIRNEGNANVTLALLTSNWSPTDAATYISLSWTYDNQTIPVNEAMQVTLGLTIASDVTGITSFSFDVLVTAVG